MSIKPQTGAQSGAQFGASAGDRRWERGGAQKRSALGTRGVETNAFGRPCRRGGGGSVVGLAVNGKSVVGDHAQPDGAVGTSQIIVGQRDEADATDQRLRVAAAAAGGVLAIKRSRQRRQNRNENRGGQAQVGVGQAGGGH